MTIHPINPQDGISPTPEPSKARPFSHLTVVPPDLAVRRKGVELAKVDHWFITLAALGGVAKKREDKK